MRRNMSLGLTSDWLRGVRSCPLPESFVNLVARYSSRVVSSCRNARMICNTEMRCGRDGTREHAFNTIAHHTTEYAVSAHASALFFTCTHSVANQAPPHERIAARNEALFFYSINPFRTPVPFWGQATQIPSNLSPIVPKTRLQS